MKKFLTLGITLCLAAGFASAARYDGRLMDAACYNSEKVATHNAGHKTYHSITKTCAATPATTDFAIRITGNAFHEDEGLTIKLDGAGNAMAASEIKNGTLTPGTDGVVRVRASGKLFGETFLTRYMSARGSSIGRLE